MTPEQYKALKKENAVLKKRDTALRKIIAQLMWLKYTKEGETKTIDELNNVFEAYEVNETLKGHKLIVHNQNWCVHQKLDEFLSQFNQ